MKTLTTGIGMLLGGFLMFIGPQQPAATAEKPTVVLGTFDSRAITLAYVGSDAFGDYLSAQKTDIERAKEAGDSALVASLQDLGPTMQRRIHLQGFGTAPVDDILVHIEDELPGIAKKAGVDVIVSKWAISYHKASAQFVDVTDLLVAEFGPDEKTLKSIRQIVQQEPVPPEQLRDH